MPYNGNFLSPDSKKKRPTTYLVTTWWFLSLSADILDKKIQVIGFLKSGNNIIAIFTKSTRYCSCVNQIIPDWSGIEACFKESQKVWGGAKNIPRVRKVIYVYPTNPALQRFDKVKIVQKNFFQDIQDESLYFGENI